MASTNATHLGVVLGVTRVQGNSLEVEPALEVDRCDNVSVAGLLFVPNTQTTIYTYWSTGTSPCTAVISGTLAGARIGGADVLPYESFCVSSLLDAELPASLLLDAVGTARPDMVD
jgi:hypothetical protein